MTGGIVFIAEVTLYTDFQISTGGGGGGATRPVIRTL